MIPSEEAARHTFFLNPYLDQQFRHCPRCETTTHPRTRILLIYVRPDIVVPLKATCRYCTRCDLLVADKGELSMELQERLSPEEWEASAGEFVVAGTLDRARMGRIPLEELSMDEAIEAFRPFNDLVHFEMIHDDEGVWFEEVPLPSPLTSAHVPVPETVDLNRLPQSDEVWEIAARRMPTWIAGEEDEPFRPYTILVVSSSGPLVVFQELARERPSLQDVRNVLWKAMSAPTMGAGQPRRPATVHTDEKALANALRPELADLGVACDVGPLAALNSVFDDLTQYLSGREEPVPGLLDTPGVTPQQVGELFEAAADFYDLAPWEWLYNEDLIAVRYPLPDGEWRYVSVMGNAGMEFGLAVFESLEDFDLVATAPDPELTVGEMTYRSLTFDDVTVVPFADLDALEEYGWEVAGDDAYPIPFILTRDRRVLRPGPEEVQWYIVTLRAVAAFVEEYWPEEEGLEPEPVAIVMKVPLGDQQVEVELRYPADVVTEEELTAAGQQVFRFKARRGRRGRIKRIEILGSQTLGDFDAILRDTFNYDFFDHLSGFWIAGGRGEPDIDLGSIEPFGGGEGADILIGFLDLEVGDELKYVYDFGDWIEHTIALEAIVDREGGVEYPRAVK